MPDAPAIRVERAEPTLKVTVGGLIAGSVLALVLDIATGLDNASDRSAAFALFLAIGAAIALVATRGFADALDRAGPPPPGARVAETPRRWSYLVPILVVAAAVPFVLGDGASVLVAIWLAMAIAHGRRLWAVRRREEQGDRVLMRGRDFFVEL